MKIAFLADNQVDERSRLEEHDRVMDFIATDLRERKCDLVLHGGDVYERRSTARERASVHRFLRVVGLHTYTFIVGGNHEAPGEVEELECLPKVRAMERPGMLPFGGADGPLVAFLPWPRRSSLAAWVGKPLGREELNAVGLDALRSILRGFAQEWKDWKGPKILLAHCMIRGSRMGQNEPIMPGQDFEIGLEDLALAKATVNLCGHIHRPQEWDGCTGCPCRCGEPDGLCSHCDLPTEITTIYAGSPRRTAYASGELEEKGYVVLEFDGPRLVKWERVPTPATAMILMEAEWIEGLDEAEYPSGFKFTVEGIDRKALKGAEIRFRYTVDADNRESAKWDADEWVKYAMMHGAAEVKVEPIIRPRSVARLAAVAGDKPLAEKIAHVWDRDQVPAERRPSLLTRLSELEGGASS